MPLLKFISRRESLTLIENQENTISPKLFRKTLEHELSKLNWVNKVIKVDEILYQCFEIHFLTPMKISEDCENH